MALYCLIKGLGIVTGDNTKSLVEGVCDIQLDFVKRNLYIDYNNIGMDSITYSMEYNNEEYVKEAYARALILLQREGWELYRKCN